ncbi:cytochrome b/b6 domain-containing protein [Ruegeria sp. HKCCD7559]|uniref:cytochrome b/b6 domain-containing protein n=1 Tax=Ruegeria sp. HKCCD7559 TaxID=2683005 RepID=UPI0014923987|nr:cytochrome b/b6 domain-containing protein [Ruegeria sp. HKCCD7559]NOC44301.1 cytochrome [Ruegeria sp. HKCCD7559]
MASTNSFSSYGSVAKTFHWLTALLIFTALPLGWIADNLAHAVLHASTAPSEAEIARAARMFSLHKTIGVTVFFVALARIVWAFTQTKPGLLNADNKPEAFAAETVHWLLYGSLVLVPLTGWVHHAATEGFAPILWPFGQNLPFVAKSTIVAEVTGVLHWLFMWTLVGALVLHVAGALKHHVIDKDSTLRRMLPGGSDAPEPPHQHHSLVPAVAAVAVWALVLTGGWVSGEFAREADDDDADVQLAEVQSDWQVQNGTLSITISQLGSPVTGSFSDWTAAIAFDDPAEPGPAGSVEVTIAIGSLSLGTVTEQAMGADFFNNAQFPTAQFTADLFKTESGYEARGPLTIRDKTIDIILPFSLELEDDTATMTGSVDLNRLDFGIGASQPTEDSLGFTVTVAVELAASRSQ